MSAIPEQQVARRVIEADRVSQAVDALQAAPDVRTRAARFAILGDPTRLSLLTCIEAAEPISVSDLAAATGINDTTVSQTLRYLRAAQVVDSERDGRVVRYRLIDSAVSALLARESRSPRAG